MSLNKEEIERLTFQHKKELKKQLPQYAWAYEEGEAYVRRSFMKEIEEDVAEFRAKLMAQYVTQLENALEQKKQTDQE